MGFFYDFPVFSTPPCLIPITQEGEGGDTQLNVPSDLSPLEGPLVLVPTIDKRLSKDLGPLNSHVENLSLLGEGVLHSSKLVCVSDSSPISGHAQLCIEISSSPIEEDLGPIFPKPSSPRVKTFHHSLISNTNLHVPIFFGLAEDNQEITPIFLY